MVTISRRDLLRFGTVLVTGEFLLACSSASGAVGGSLTRSRAATGLAPLATRTFRSAAMRGRRVGWGVQAPSGATSLDGLPVCLVLHGRGGTWRSGFDDLGLSEALDAAAVHRQFVVATVDGGDHSYHHPRHDGTDAQAMLVHEYLPLLAARGLDVRRFGVLGWSMGGYGAFLLAETLGRARVAFVAAASPALWQRAGDSAPGAFDDDADFRRHDVFARRSRLAGIPVRVAIGSSDPFLAATRTFVREVPDLRRAVVRAGGHDAGFWRSTIAAQLAFVAGEL